MTRARILERANMALSKAPASLNDARPAPAAQPERGAAQLAAPSDTVSRVRQNFEAIPFKKRALVIAAAIAVPAMAAPGDFGALPAPAPLTNDDFAARKIVEAALPFERPGQSFPGSAFYYLGDPPKDKLLALPTMDAFDTGAEGARELGSAIDAGPAARPFFSAASGNAHLRAKDCLAQAIWYEAASEREAGQRAVAQVVLNRVAHSSWPGSVCGVVYEGSLRSTGCQFSFTCDGSLARRARGASWDTAQRLAREALSGSVYSPIGHATHYHTLWVNPYWASSLDHIGTIGAHRFYRNRGAAGEKSAFTGRYAGVEPAVRGRVVTASSDGMLGEPGSSVADGFAPITGGGAAASSGALSSPSDPAGSPAPVPAANTPAPRLADPSFEGAGSVKSDFSNAGQWKKKPGAKTDANSGANSEAKSEPDND